MELLADRDKLAKPKGLKQFLQEIESALSPFRSVAAKWDALRRFRRREMVKLIAADLLGLMDLATLTAELSDLAEAILKVGLELVRGAEFGGRGQFHLKVAVKFWSSPSGSWAQGN